MSVKENPTRRVCDSAREIDERPVASARRTQRVPERLEAVHMPPRPPASFYLPITVAVAVAASFVGFGSGEPVRTAAVFVSVTPARDGRTTIVTVAD